MRLRDLDAVVLLLFLCETHQLDPDVLEASPDSWRCKRFVDIMGGGRGGGGKEGKEVAAARAAVVALRSVEVIAGDGGGVECVICKEEMRQGRDVCEMPCKHLFHWKCILPWLSKTNTCPFCRFQLPTDDVFAEIQRLWEILLKSSDLHVA
ncbi:PREDICTED: E3 ubiquitin-protein ligase SGR9, amyloplastic-like isoform X1 [Tarenaya hassleriana]|uniref:E3 ubiquitin-protein ligase SGR9, amyloplastic-like isoform X1 n=1 Tax=Tarenaya hassleriana TaxID=28532 RepID=UPI00053C9A66|nr:PREDICTED: E3 ubiquitin-protein ligase SGR9, amyloplastic-like isoform X1 [Tarenaya hassleriana]